MRKFLIGIAYLLLAMPAWATTYYVAQSDGCDGYDGLADHYVSGTNGAYWSITKAAAVMVAGDTALIRTGNYNAKLIIPTSGTSAAWITYKNYPGESPVLDGSLLDYSTNAALIYNLKNYIQIEGLTLTGVASASAYGICSLGATSPNTWRCGLNIINVSVHNCNGLNPIGVIGQYGYASITVKDCNVYSNTTNAMEGIRVDGKSWYFKILNNYVRDCSNIGIDVVGKPTSSEIQPRYGVVSGNRVERCGFADTGSSFYLDAGQYTLVENNVSYDSHGGLAICAETKGLTCAANIVRNNLIVNSTHYHLIVGSAWNLGDVRLNRIYSNSIINGLGQLIELGFYYDGSTNKILNNIFKAANTINYMVYSREGNTPTAAAYGMDYNSHYPSNDIYQIKGTNYTGLTNWQAQAGGCDTLGTIGTDPLLNSSYTLGAGSPCIDTGTTLTVTSDAGTGTTFSVTDARFFQPGWGAWGTSDYYSGDTITVNGTSHVITAVDYTNNSITVSASFTWASGQYVSTPFSGTRPDMGYAEYTASANHIPTVRRTGRSWKALLPWKW